jgi:hypothetical protein
MRYWRALVLWGVPSLAGARGVGASAPPEPKREKSARQMFAPGYSAQPRPPGMADDHPKILDGTYY